MKVFISYNHKEKLIADTLKELLQRNDIEVTIDSADMKAGDKIKEFIDTSINNTDAIISIVSTNSLLSAWVGMESIKTLYRNKKFIACYVDNDFFNRGFVRKAEKKISEEINDIKNEIIEALKVNIGITHLQDELERYEDLHHNLSRIVAELKSMLCIDISCGKIEDNISNILKALNMVHIEFEEMHKWWSNLSVEWKNVFEKNLGTKIFPTNEQLQKLLSLKSIDCFGMQISNLGPLRMFNNLEILHCGKTLINSLEPLKKLSRLEFIDCHETYISSLIPIQGLSNLKNLVCFGTKLTSKEIDMFRQYNQSCHIQL